VSFLSFFIFILEDHEKELIYHRHGLSYTTFALSDLKVTYDKHTRVNDPIARAILKIQNTGSLPGSEILQLYISAPNSPTQRPLKELHGFEKVFLQPGEGKEVEIAIDNYATSFWDESEGKWCSEMGDYVVVVQTGGESVKGGVVRLETGLRVEKTVWWLGL
jgi:beta-glucosidase